MLVEIQSLCVDPERGCFKSNKGFAEFFGLSNGRVSQIIKSLEEKGFIKISYRKDGERIVERNIYATPEFGFQGQEQKDYLRGDWTPATYLESQTPYLENAGTPIKNSKGGYLENAEESNTSKSNTYRETPSESPAPSKRGTRLPDDWTLTNQYREAALTARPDLENRIDTVAANFRDYWHSATGKSATKRDWLAAWRFWVRNERQSAAQFKTAAEKRSERAAATYDYDRATTF